MATDSVAFEQQLSDEFSSGNINLAKLCRLCLRNNAKMFPLVSNCDPQLLSDKLSTFTTLRIQTEDGLPQHVCESCKSLIITCHEFKLMCEKSNSLLESLLNRPIKIEPYNADLIPSTDTKDNFIIKSEGDFDDLKIEAEYLENLSDDSEALHIVQNEEKMEENVDKLSKERKISMKKTNKIENKTKLCPFSCGKKLLNISHMKEHIKMKHTNLVLSHPCGQCKKAFVSEQDLDLHAAVHTKTGPWKCKHCQKEFQDRNKLRRHIQWHMGQKRYSCEQCNKCFVELYALRRHMRVHTGETVQKNHPCEQCGKRFIDKRTLQVHQSSHTGYRPFPCDVCAKMFPSLRLLSSHSLTHSDDKPHACTHCDKRFRHESTRNTHVRTHTGDRPYVCSVCGKTFIQNSNLTLHMRTHTGERPYSCEQCEKKFTSGSSLKLHIRSHTGEKPYSCKVCGKKFARKSLNAHMLRHTGERPYPCNICPKTFTNKVRLLEHSRSHTGEKPFVCNHCSQGFTTKSLLKKHSKCHTKKKLLTDSKVLASGPAVKKQDEEIILQISRQPLEVGGKIILDSEIKTDLLVVDNTSTSNYHARRFCLSSNGIELVDNEGNNVNLVTVDGSNLSISTPRVMQGTTVKLFQIDDGILEIAEEQVTSEL